MVSFSDQISLHPARSTRRSSRDLRLALKHRRLGGDNIWGRLRDLPHILQLPRQKGKWQVGSPDIQGVRTGSFALEGRVSVHEITVGIVFYYVARGVEPGFRVFGLARSRYLR